VDHLSIFGTDNKMIRYSQQDAKWKDKQLGSGEYTIGQAGCLLTCFAMLAQYPPDELNQKMVVYGGFTGSLINSYVLPSVIPNLYFESRIPCEKTPAPIDIIDKALSAGKAVIVQVDTSPSEGVQSHWVILTGKVGKDYNMVDPWPVVDNPPATVLGRYGSGRKIEAVITYIYVIGGDGVEIPPVTTEPKPSGKVVIDAVGLRGRTEPSTNAPIVVNAIPRGMQFTPSDEPPIIVNGYKWIAVKVWIAAGTQDGQQVFVR
jgi:hypothetical protein